MQAKQTKSGEQAENEKEVKNFEKPKQTEVGEKNTRRIDRRGIRLSNRWRKKDTGGGITNKEGLENPRKITDVGGKK